MSLIKALILGIVQGLTEFLPVSSSGHLQLVPWVFGWEFFTEDQQGIANAFDVALHIGTLAGAAAYFWADIVRYARAAIMSIVSVTGRRSLDSKYKVDARVAWLLIVATIPAGITGVLLESVLASDDHIWLTALCLGVFGVVLVIADRFKGRRNADEFSLLDALALGIGQAVALQPGVSRSGITMTVARMRGFDRVAAARLSFLMSLPVIAGAGLFKYLDVGGLGGIPSDIRAAFAVGMAAAAVTGWLAVWGLIKLVSKTSFAAFAVYRIIAAVGVFALLLTRS